MENGDDLSHHVRFVFDLLRNALYFKGLDNNYGCYPYDVLDCSGHFA